MSLIGSLLNENLVHAFGWTLIHSIWQILIIGLVLRILLSLFKNISANSKYKLSALSLLLILAISIITFFNYSNSEVPHNYDENYSITTAFNELETNESDQSNIQTSIVQPVFIKISTSISSNINIIVGLWLVGLFGFYVRLAGSFWYIYRLKTKNLIPLSNEWNSLLNKLKQKLQLKKVIGIAESTAIQIPIVIGHLKPLILFPIGMLSALPYNQVEAIILHELAHIKRNDYIINLIKSFIEIIFFYHPVLWWISSRIDDEREHCCDDLTIQSCNEASSLQHALLNLQELNRKPTYIAAALFKNNHQLLKRIKRMKTTNLPNGSLRQNNQGKLSNLAGMYILLSGIIILTTFSAFSPNSTDLPIEYQSIEKPESAHLFIKPSDDKLSEEPQTNLILSIPAPDSTKKEKMEKDIENDNDLDKDDDRDIDKELEKEMQVVQQAIEKAEQKMEVARKAYDRAMAEYHDAVSKSFDLQGKEEWTIAQEEFEKAIALAKLQREDLDIHIPDIEEIFQKEMLEKQLKQLESQLSKIEMIDQIEIDEEQMAKELELMEAQLSKQLEELKHIHQFEFEGQVLETKIRDELVKDGLLVNKHDDLSFILTKSTLEVNGKSLTAKQHQKYLILYEEISNKKLEGTTKVIIED